MVTEFDAQLQKGDNPGAWTCAARSTAEPFDGALMAQGDVTHRLPVRAGLRKAIGKEADEFVHVRIDERRSG